MLFFNKKNIKRGHGFSLIELMVSLSVFAIVMVVSTGTLLTMIDANAKAQALYSAGTNLSFALDSMTREMRTGYRYNCYSSTYGSQITSITSTGDCGSGSGENTVALLRGRDGADIRYLFDGGKIYQYKSGSGWAPLTANDVVIDAFDIEVQNTDTFISSSDEQQPTITLFIKGHVNNGLDTNTDFNIQTHIVQRRIDVL